jgi:hypothetical protein
MSKTKNKYIFVALSSSLFLILVFHALESIKASKAMIILLILFPIQLDKPDRHKLKVARDIQEIN